MLEIYGLCTFSKYIAELQQPLDVDKVDLEKNPFALPGTDLSKAIADGDELRRTRPTCTLFCPTFTSS